MARLAFFSPLPPAPTGIADYTLDVLQVLSPLHVVDVFHGQQSVDSTRLPAACRAYAASEFVERNAARPYDLAVHQLGNGTVHAFQYEWLARAPGLLVLHDLVLHHARAQQFLRSPEALAYAGNPSHAGLREAALRRLQDYRDEVAYSYPSQAGRLADAQLETAGRLLPYGYPLFRLPVEASRATAVHNAFMADAIRNEVEDARVVGVAMPIAPVAVSADVRARQRVRYGIADDALVVASFGMLTPEKRISTIARAAARARTAGLSLRLLLVGPVEDAAALWRELHELGLRDDAVVTGRVPFEDLAAYMSAADVVAHLRYPSAGETSAALLRVLAQGRATVMSDLPNFADVPETAAVKIDVRDEEGGVLRALLRLAARPAERERLGRTAAAYVARRHSAERCLATYEAAIEAALRSEPGRCDAWPAHWRGLA